MQIVYVSDQSSDYVVKCLVEMLRLSGKYPKGVARRKLLDNLHGPWDIVVVTNVTAIASPLNTIFIDIQDTDLRIIHRKVGEQASKYGLV